jgi:streptogramin lyase
MKSKLASRISGIALVLGSSASLATAQRITEFPVAASPGSIAAGPHGDLWFTQGNKIGRITTTGEITEFPVPGNPSGITAGPDDNIWFTESGNNKIGQINAFGQITEFAKPSSGPSVSPRGIAVGPDGNLWFAESNFAPAPNYTNGWIGRITPAGVITEFQIPSIGNGARNVAAGPDGNLWFTTAKEIGKITTEGVVTKVSDFGGGDITAGPDGNLWFTRGNEIARIYPDGGVKTFPIPSGGSAGGIARAQDGNLWFTETAGRIGRITPDGAITEFSISAASHPVDIVAGPDGALWFTDSSTNAIGRITIPGAADGPCLSDVHSLCLSGGRFRATATFSNPHGSGAASAASLSNSSGFFTFDNPDSVELVVKVLDACSIGSGFWVFAAGLTDQEVLLTVTDTATDEVRTYANPLGTKFVTVTDTAAFSTCP